MRRLTAGPIIDQHLTELLLFGFQPDDEDALSDVKPQEVTCVTEGMLISIDSS